MKNTSIFSYEMRKDYNNYCATSLSDLDCMKILGKIDTLFAGLYDILQGCQTTSSNNSFYYQYAKWAFPFSGYQSHSKNFLSSLIDSATSNANPCIDLTKVEEYLNKEEIKQSLHVDSSIVWESCRTLTYRSLAEASLYLYPKLIQHKLKILIFSGDTDLVVPFNGSQRWIDSLKLETVFTVEKLESV